MENATVTVVACVIFSNIVTLLGSGAGKEPNVDREDSGNNNREDLAVDTREGRKDLVKVLNRILLPKGEDQQHCDVTSYCTKLDNIGQCFNFSKL